jgi:hypothetical protein
VITEKEDQMDKPASISLHQLTASVQAAVKAAAAKHPKFRAVPEPSAVSFGNLIWGFPVPDGVLAQVTVAEFQSYTTDVAAQIGQAVPQGLTGAVRAPEGVILSVARVVHCGIPPISEFHTVEG